MKAIILAAGEGTRLRPYTNDRPKCMVEFSGRPLIDHILGTMNECGLNDIVIVAGYRENILKAHLTGKNVRFVTNPQYNSTNMLATLFFAENEMNDDVIISYADIIYKKDILSALMKSEAPFAIAVDRKWKELWSLRMDDPLKDAETLKIDENGNVKELGKKPLSFDDIQGQYMGLTKISKDAIKKVKDHYHSLDRSQNYDGKDFNHMYMTSFIQHVIDYLMPVKPVFIDGGWIEIDSKDDLEIYNLKEIKF